MIQRVKKTVKIRLQGASESKQKEFMAQLVLNEFDVFYNRFKEITESAKDAFENCDFQESLQISQKRLSQYSVSMYGLGDEITKSLPDLSKNQEFWDGVEDNFRQFVEYRYEGDLALAYLHSVRRAIFRGEWTPVDYSFGVSSDSKTIFNSFLMVTFHTDDFDSSLVLKILRVLGFKAKFRQAENEAKLAAVKIMSELKEQHENYKIQKVEIIKGGFFRNRGAYIVGRIILNDSAVLPLIIALLNGDDGIYIDAIFTSDSATHNLFSTTRANFHVNNHYYHELSEFLHSIMPMRTLGLHYSTIGFNHFGKVAVMQELKEDLVTSDGIFDFSIGFMGTVAIGFQSPKATYNLKVIRNSPTSHYKWGEFEGVSSVLSKYSLVHVINRTGSMLDNIIFYNVKLEKKWFSDALIEELLTSASECVSYQGDALFFRHLIVQSRLTPLPVFLETASQADSETAIVNLGYCIKNNIAANIFNKDLDARNYGVGGYSKVYLFDYDALEQFAEVKVRTNKHKFEGEEDVPDWFFEEGVVFLPEEIESGLRIPKRSLRKLFREVHGDLLEVDYYIKIQEELNSGKVPSVRVYPEWCQISKS